MIPTEQMFVTDYIIRALLFWESWACAMEGIYNIWPKEKAEEAFSFTLRCETMLDKLFERVERTLKRVLGAAVGLVPMVLSASNTRKVLDYTMRAKLLWKDWDHVLRRVSDMYGDEELEFVVQNREMLEELVFDVEAVIIRLVCLSMEAR